ncbi:hypothetical protein CDD83_10480 [Cordyceps sp. RAO-2017]|nr:hypothetical protein CDD83_10480 [Cordyceps sp. RAO-2017]
MRPLLLWAPVAAAAAAPLAGVFSLEAARATGETRDFAADMAAARLRWGPAEQPPGFALTQGEGRVVAQPLAHDQAYIAEVALGSPPQMVKLALDTGSADV